MQKTSPGSLSPSVAIWKVEKFVTQLLLRREVSMVTHSNRTLHFFTLCTYAHKTLAVQYRSIRSGTHLLIGLFLPELIPMKTLFIPLLLRLTSIFWPQPCSILFCRPCFVFAAVHLFGFFFSINSMLLDVLFDAFIYCIFFMFYFLPFLSLDKKKI